jgi:hypothetical protein
MFFVQFQDWPEFTEGLLCGIFQGFQELPVGAIPEADSSFGCTGCDDREIRRG